MKNLKLEIYQKLKKQDEEKINLKERSLRKPRKSITKKFLCAKKYKICLDCLSYFFISSFITFSELSKPLTIRGPYLCCSIPNKMQRAGGAMLSMLTEIWLDLVITKTSSSFQTRYKIVSTQRNQAVCSFIFYNLTTDPC